MTKQMDIDNNSGQSPINVPSNIPTPTKDEGAGQIGNVWSVNVAHSYKVNGFINPTIRRHDCLRTGWWCWLNVREHPQDIIKYLRKKLK